MFLGKFQCLDLERKQQPIHLKAWIGYIVYISDKPQTVILENSDLSSLLSHNNSVFFLFLFLNLRKYMFALPV